MSESNPEPGTTVDLQEIVDAVVAVFDDNSVLADQIAAMPQQAIAQVQQQLMPVVPLPGVAVPRGPDPALFQALQAHVLGQLGAAALTADQTEELTSLATQYHGQSLAHVLATDRRLPFSMQSWQSVAARRQARAARAAGPTLAALTGVADSKIIIGQIEMGDIGIGSHSRPLLWTSALAGCVGVAVYDGAVSFLAHLKPDQLKTVGHPSPLDNTVTVIRDKVPLNGASFWMSSPTQGQYVTDLQNRLLNAGAHLVAQFPSDTLALRTTDGAVFHNFPPPQ
jgi:hypothetical protein